jgi:hypothetical protein
MTVSKSTDRIKNKGHKALILAIILIIISIIAILYFYNEHNPGAGVLGNACIASYNYTCQNQFINATTGNLIVTVSQNTDKNWTNVYFVFVDQNKSFNSSYFQSQNSTYINHLESGDMVTITLPLANQVKNGEWFIGSIWAKYNSSNMSISYVKIALINAESTK